jgi:hypothetical protein
MKKSNGKNYEGLEDPASFLSLLWGLGAYLSALGRGGLKRGH